MTHTSAAEEIRALLDQLHGQVETREQVTRYRQVRRDKTGKTVAVLDLATHTTREPGLLAQLGVISDHKSEARVEVRRWIPDVPHPDDPTRCGRPSTARRDKGGNPVLGCEGLCAHGRWVTAGVETRPVPATTTGAAVPGGSPGWDADGALSPIVGGGKPEAAEPIADGWHVGDEIRGALRELGQELHERGWRPPMTLVDIALKDEREGAWIAGRLRGLVARARIAADYDAPVKVLRDVYCPDCGGEMRVRADASSAVWCAGTWAVEGPAERGERWPLAERCGATWPRGAWVSLLAETESARIAG